MAVCQAQQFLWDPLLDGSFIAAGSLKIEYTLATVGANKLWHLMKNEPFVPALGALSGNQAMQMVRAGLKAIYCSGWQVGSASPWAATATYTKNLL